MNFSLSSTIPSLSVNYNALKVNGSSASDRYFVEILSSVHDQPSCTVYISITDLLTNDTQLIHIDTEIPRSQSTILHPVLIEGNAAIFVTLFYKDDGSVTPRVGIVDLPAKTAILYDLNSSKNGLAPIGFYNGYLYLQDMLPMPEVTTIYRVALDGDFSLETYKELTTRVTGKLRLLRSDSGFLVSGDSEYTSGVWSVDTSLSILEDETLGDAFSIEKDFLIVSTYPDGHFNLQFRNISGSQTQEILLSGIDLSDSCRLLEVTAMQSSNQGLTLWIFNPETSHYHALSYTSSPDNPVGNVPVDDADVTVSDADVAVFDADVAVTNADVTVTDAAVDVDDADVTVTDADVAVVDADA